MSLTTTISTINTLPPSPLHYTQKPTYKYHVEFVGMGVDAFLGEIPIKKAVRFKEWDKVRLKSLVHLYEDCWGAPYGMLTEVPMWARKAEHQFHMGLDITQPYRMTVYDDGENIVYVHDHNKYEMVVLPSFDNEPDQEISAPSLYAIDMFPLHLRFPIETDKPFSPMQIAMDSTVLFDKLIFKDFLYEGKNIEGQSLNDVFGDDREVKIIYN